MAETGDHLPPSAVAPTRIAGGARDGCLAASGWPFGNMAVTPGRIELASWPFSRVGANRSEIDGIILRKGWFRTYVRLDSPTPGISRFVFWSYSSDEIAALLTRNGWSFRTEPARRFETPLFGRY